MDMEGVILTDNVLEAAEQAHLEGPYDGHGVSPRDGRLGGSNRAARCSQAEVRQIVQGLRERVGPSRLSSQAITGAQRRWPSRWVWTVTSPKCYQPTKPIT